MTITYHHKKTWKHHVTIINPSSMMRTKMSWMMSRMSRRRIVMNKRWRRTRRTMERKIKTNQMLKMKMKNKMMIKRTMKKRRRQKKKKKVQKKKSHLFSRKENQTKIKKKSRLRPNPLRPANHLTIKQLQN